MKNLDLLTIHSNDRSDRKQRKLKNKRNKTTRAWAQWAPALNTIRLTENSRQAVADDTNVAPDESDGTLGGLLAARADRKHGKRYTVWVIVTSVLLLFVTLTFFVGLPNQIDDALINARLNSTDGMYDAMMSFGLLFNRLLALTVFLPLTIVTVVYMIRRVRHWDLGLTKFSLKLSQLPGHDTALDKLVATIDSGKAPVVQTITYQINADRADKALADMSSRYGTVTGATDIDAVNAAVKRANDRMDIYPLYACVESDGNTTALLHVVVVNATGMNVQGIMTHLHYKWSPGMGYDSAYAATDPSLYPDVPAPKFNLLDIPLVLAPVFMIR